MRRAFRWSDLLVQTSNQLRLAHYRRPFCTEKKPNSTTNPNRTTNDVEGTEGSSSSKFDPYKALENLNFENAAKIIFSEPQRKKKFGIDFHLVQLFFVCLPSFAVYLVAQYARSEMRRMDRELELKKQAEEQAKIEKANLESAEAEIISDRKLLEVKKRLDRLEETVKEIVVESKRESSSTTGKTREDDSEKKKGTRTEPSNTQNGTKGIDFVAASGDCKDTANRRTTGSSEAMTSESVPVSNAPQKDEKGSQVGGPCRDAKK